MLPGEAARDRPAVAEGQAESRRGLGYSSVCSRRLSAAASISSAYFCRLFRSACLVTSAISRRAISARWRRSAADLGSFFVAICITYYSATNPNRFCQILRPTAPSASSLSIADLRRSPAGAARLPSSACAASAALQQERVDTFWFGSEGSCAVRRGIGSSVSLTWCSSIPASVDIDL